MNINKFVFMVWFCNVDDAMLEQFCVHEATGHEIYRARLKNCRAVLFTGRKKKRYTQLCNVKSLWTRTREKEVCR